jgi:hypothetical protein
MTLARHLRDPQFDNLANSHVERRWIDAGPGEIRCACAFQNR